MDVGCSEAQLLAVARNATDDEDTSSLYFSRFLNSKALVSSNAGVTGSNLPSFVSESVVITGLEVTVLAGQVQTTTVDKSLKCYAKHLELKSHGHGIEADDRTDDVEGALGDDGSAKLAPTTVGSVPQHDLWGRFGSHSDIFTDSDLYVEFEAEVKGDDVLSATESINCSASCAQLRISYLDDVLTDFGVTTAAHQQMSEMDGSVWSWFYETNTAPPSQGAVDWRSPSYDDAAWPRGPSDLGYGDKSHKGVAKEATLLPTGDDSHNKPLVAYFRSNFTLGKPLSCYKYIRIAAVVDDGAIFWLNGHALWLFNMVQSSPIPGPNATADRLADNEEKRKHAMLTATHLLATGYNQLAVQVHQYEPQSTDLHLDVSLDILDSCEDIRDTTAPSPAGTTAPVVHCESGVPDPLGNCPCVADGTCTDSTLACIDGYCLARVEDGHVKGSSTGGSSGASAFLIVSVLVLAAGVAVAVYFYRQRHLRFTSSSTLGIVRDDDGLSLTDTKFV
jgi:hypothetical protein